MCVNGNTRNYATTVVGTCNYNVLACNNGVETAVVVNNCTVCKYGGNVSARERWVAHSRGGGDMNANATDVSAGGHEAHELGSHGDVTREEHPLTRATIQASPAQCGWLCCPRLASDEDDAQSRFAKPALHNICTPMMAGVSLTSTRYAGRGMKEGVNICNNQPRWGREDH